MRIVGLISGTSMDGIDVAAANFELSDRRVDLHPLGSKTIPYEPSLRHRLAEVLPPATTTVEAVCRLDTHVGQAFANAAKTAIIELASGTADLVASHGQTVYHWVEAQEVQGTLQIGQPAWIAEVTGLPVIADLRSRDVACGGQGAPLAALFDVLLLGGSEPARAALNIGGISNLTVVTPDAGPVSFDVGPGNALIDAAVRYHSGSVDAFDRDGEMARRGTVNQSLLDRLLADPYYQLAPPKTTGKEHFHLPYLQQALADSEVAPDDLVATVTALTAVTIRDTCRQYQVSEVVVSGGGTSNPTLMEMLAAELTGVAITPIDALGIPADAKEAYFIALVGFLTAHQLPGNVPDATGAIRPAILGTLLPGLHGFPPLAGPTEPPTSLRIVPSEAW